MENSNYICEVLWDFEGQSNNSSTKILITKIK